MRRHLASLALACSLASGLSAGHEVVAGERYLDTLMGLLSRPGVRSVDAIQFRFSKVDQPRLVTGKILQRLAQLARKKARVRVFLDNHDRGNRDAIRALREAGVEVRHTGAGHTSHTKAICVNRRQLLLGSTNWTHTSLTRNNEVNLLLDDPEVAAAYTAYFERLWSGDHANQPTASGPSAGVQLLTDAAFLPAARALIGRARDTLDIATYFLAYRARYARGNDRVVGDLLEAIARQVVAAGVKVRVFLDHNGIPGKGGHTRSAQNAIASLRQRIAEGLATSGAGGRADDFLQVVYDPYRKISHGKILLRDAGGADSELLLGSTNLYWKDLTKNLQLNVRSTNAELNAAVARYFERLLGEGALYHRFWRGVRRQVWNPELVAHFRDRREAIPCAEGRSPTDPMPFDQDDFECLVNTWLIPATPSYAAATSLQAYMPVLPSRDHPPFVHDEIAVITYGDEAEYKRLRSVGGPEGESYGPLHMDVFGSERDGIRSGSMVPQPYAGRVEFTEVKGEMAACYDLFSGRPNWREGATRVRILKRSGGTSAEDRAALQADLDRVQASRDLDGYLVLIGRDTIIDYAHAASARAFRALPWGPGTDGPHQLIESFDTVPLERQVEDPLAYTNLRYGQAGNLRFTPGVKPGKVRHYRLERP